MTKHSYLLAFSCVIQSFSYAAQEGFIVPRANPTGTIGKKTHQKKRKKPVRKRIRDIRLSIQAARTEINTLSTQGSTATTVLIRAAAYEGIDDLHTVLKAMREELRAMEPDNTHEQVAIAEATVAIATITKR